MRVDQPRQIGNGLRDGAGREIAAMTELQPQRQSGAVGPQPIVDPQRQFRPGAVEQTLYPSGVQPVRVVMMSMPSANRVGSPRNLLIA